MARSRVYSAKKIITIGILCIFSLSQVSTYAHAFGSAKTAQSDKPQVQTESSPHAWSPDAAPMDSLYSSDQAPLNDVSLASDIEKPRYISLTSAGESGEGEGEVITTPSYYWPEKLQLEDAHRVTMGAGVIIAVIERGGVEYEHEALNGNIWINPNEISGNGIDDDNNGYIDDVHGWDFIDNSNDPSAADPEESFHGTGVAGIIGSMGGDSFFSGIAPESTILPVRTSTLTETAEAIRYAVDMGADVINLSRGVANDVLSTWTDEQVEQFGDLMQSAIDYAHEEGVIVVVAAGNEGTTDDPNVSHMYGGLNHTIAVGATTSDNSRLAESSYGEHLDFVAPGGEVLTLAPSTYGSGAGAVISGTSFAAPMVSGVIALMLSVDPTLNYDEIMYRLSITTTDLGESDRDNETGFGLVNAFRALQAGSLHLDTSGDGYITARDALAIINVLNRVGSGSVEDIARLQYNGDVEKARRLDTSGDGRVTPRDGLLIINFLNHSDLYKPESGKITNSNTPYSAPDPSLIGEGEGFARSNYTAEDIQSLLAPIVQLLNQTINDSFWQMLGDNNHNNTYDISDVVAIIKSFKHLMTEEEYSELKDSGLRQEIRNNLGQIVTVRIFEVETGDVRSREENRYRSTGSLWHKAIYNGSDRRIGDRYFDYYGRMYYLIDRYDTGRTKLIEYYNTSTGKAYYRLKYYETGRLSSYEYYDYWTGILRWSRQY